MSERFDLPFDDNDLPLPDENAAWQKMSQLLDKEERRRPVAFWWRTGALAFLLLAVGAGSYVYLNGDESSAPTSLTSATGAPAPGKNNTPATNRKTSEQSTTQRSTKANALPADPSPLQSTVDKKQNIQTNMRSDAVAVTIASPRSKQVVAQTGATGSVQTAATESKTKTETTTSTTTVSAPIQQPLPSFNATVEKQQPFSIDSVKKATAETVQPKAAEPVAATEESKPKKEEVLPSMWTLRAGVGFQQAIAYSGQGSADINYKGKRAALSDRIPSVFVQLQKERVFVQAEFQYSVPQPVGSFVFSITNRFDAATLTQVSKQTALKKLYYHQLPLTVNYHLLPRLSVGGGLTYSILAGAVTEEESRSRNVANGSEAIRKELATVRGFTDSFLYKTTTGVTVQTTYHWRRLSLGLRFTQQLQPFINYTLPNGELAGRRNGALQAALRFRLLD